MKLLLITLSIVAVIVAFYLVSYTRENVYEATKPVIEGCTNGLTKVDKLGNIFSCIDNEWIYIGNENSGNKG